MRGGAVGCEDTVPVEARLRSPNSWLFSGMLPLITSAACPLAAGRGGGRRVGEFAWNDTDRS